MAKKNYWSVSLYKTFAHFKNIVKKVRASVPQLSKQSGYEDFKDDD